MANNLEFSINIMPTGIEKVSQLPSIINDVSNSIQKANRASNSFDRLMGVLTNIERILMGIGKVGVAQFNKLNDILDTNNRGFNKAAIQAGNLENKIKSVGNASKSSGKEIQESFLDKFNKIGLAFQSVKAIASTAAGVFSPIFEEGMSRQTAEVNFATLLGTGKSKEEAAQIGKQFAADLRNSTAATLYGTNTINDAAKNMISFGIDGDKTKTVLAQIGDIAAGDAQKFGSLSLAFAQISSAGKLQGQDLMQLINAGFNPLAEISKKTGKSIGELKDEMGKGLITSQMVEEAFASATAEGGQFNGMLEDIKNNTLQGQMAVLASSFDDIKAKVFELVLPIVNRFLPMISTKVLPLVDAIIPKLQSLKPVFDGLIFVLSSLFDYIAENIDILSTLAVAVGVVAGVITLCTSPVTGIVIAIGLLVAALVQVIKYWDEWGKYVVLICPPLALVMNLIQSVKKHWDSIVDGFSNGGILEGIKRIGLTIADAILAPIENLLELISKIPGIGGKIAGFLGGGVASLREKINSMLPEPADGAQAANGSSTQTSLETAVNAGTSTSASAAETLAKATKSKTEAVATGGTRNTQITINLDKMVEQINFNGGIEQNAQNITDQLTEALLRVLYSAQTAV